MSMSIIIMSLSLIYCRYVLFMCLAINEKMLVYIQRFRRLGALEAGQNTSVTPDDRHEGQLRARRSELQQVNLQLGEM